MIFGRKVDYAKEFSTKESIFQHIFSDRNKTELIIQSREFLIALSSSPNAALVDAVIAEEAAKGDMPSLTYMMRLLQLHLDGLDQNVPEAARIDARIQITADMRQYADIAISRGDKQNPAFYAVTSSVLLYNALTYNGARSLDGAMPDRQKSALVEAIKSIVKHGRIYVSTNPADRQLALGVQEKVDEMDCMGPIIAKMA